MRSMYVGFHANNLPIDYAESIAKVSRFVRATCRNVQKRRALQVRTTRQLRFSIPEARNCVPGRAGALPQFQPLASS